MIKIVDALPPLQLCPPGTVIGHRHYTIGATRLIPRDAALYWQGQVDTETGHARRWLASLPPLRRKWEEYEAAERLARAPLYCQPGYWGDCAYIDVRAAYPSIYTRLGWELEYYRLRWMSRPRPLQLGVPLEWKVARSLPISLHGRGWMRYWDGRAVRARPIYNKHWSPGMRWATLDVLQALARLAVDLHGAIYCNTDGYIVPEDEADALIRRLADYGLEGRCKARGETYIANLHAVIMGGHHIGAGATIPHALDNLALDLRGAAWVLRHLS